jgi:gamma-glutamylcyclotransferase (GGCT)/AIG2-like uncharacterized protein YtfP
VLGLDSTPTLQGGTIKAFKLKLSGQYPVVLPGSPDDTVRGFIYTIDFDTHYKRLAEYETNAYTICPCDVELEDRSVVRNCWTFCWAGDPASDELRDGEWDKEQ